MIGIVILNYETWDVTLQCMESIMEAENEEISIPTVLISY